MPKLTTNGMLCIEISRFGGPDVLQLVRREIPIPKDDEVLIKISAAGINRPDIFQRQGKYHPPKGASDIPGLEIAGIIVQTGKAVAELRIGDEVCALLAGGGYAEYCAVPALQVLPKPSGLSMVEASALPETFFTVWANVFESGALQPGETILIHGGSSGIGTTAIQMANIFGSRVFTTAGNKEKCLACERLGAERAIDYVTEDFVSVVLNATEGRGVDLVLDMVGGDYIPRNIEALTQGGRHVSIAFLNGSKLSQFDFMPIMLKQLTLTGSTLRTRSPAEKGRIAAHLKRQVWPLLESKQIRPQVYDTFPLANASDAHRIMEASTHIGKLVLTI